jgi:hypothetical protein
VPSRNRPGGRSTGIAATEGWSRPKDSPFTPRPNCTAVQSASLFPRASWGCWAVQLATGRAGCGLAVGGARDPILCCVCSMDVAYRLAPLEGSGLGLSLVLCSLGIQHSGYRRDNRQPPPLPAGMRHAPGPWPWPLAGCSSLISDLCSALCSLLSVHSTASQLVRSVFQSIMGSYEGAFSAEPAAGDHPRGGWRGQGSRWLWLGPRPTRSCQTWLCSGK